MQSLSTSLLADFIDSNCWNLRAYLLNAWHHYVLRCCLRSARKPAVTFWRITTALSASIWCKSIDSWRIWKSSIGRCFRWISMASFLFARWLYLPVGFHYLNHRRNKGDFTLTCVILKLGAWLQQEKWVIFGSILVADKGRTEQWKTYQARDSTECICQTAWQCPEFSCEFPVLFNLICSIPNCPVFQVILIFGYLPQRTCLMRICLSSRKKVSICWSQISHSRLDNINLSPHFSHKDCHCWFHQCWFLQSHERFWGGFFVGLFSQSHSE